MKVVGLTGGIGSGKTTVAKLFMQLGIPVYFADDNAKRLMHLSKSIKRKLVEEFGDKAYINGKLNRSYLAEIVFNDKDKLKAINAIVHPSVKNSFRRWVAKQKSNYVIQENAILFESGSFKDFDFIITVTAPIEERIRRVMLRDNSRKEEVLSRIKNQLPDKEKINQSDFVIHNLKANETQQQVLKIHNDLLKINLKQKS